MKNRRILSLIVEGDEITIQSAPYIDHGFMIKVSGAHVEIYEIPYGGGDEAHVMKCKTIIEAIQNLNKLT